MADEKLIQSIVGKLVQDAYWANQATPRPVDRLEALPTQRPADVSQAEVSNQEVVRQ